MYIFIMGYDDNDIQNDIHDWNFGKGRGTREGASSLGKDTLEMTTFSNFLKR